ncbi:MAG: hypothetical protein KGH71_02410 [Candidatus Micrarchaeota archaeon]|nr:hypothetical protein [Candidatus Micrarchaeota archaeon]
MVQMIVERSKINLVSLGNQTYEISKLGRNVLVKKQLDQSEQKKVVVDTKLDYMNILKLSLQVDSSVRKNVDETIRMIKENPKVKISKKGENVIKEDLTAIFKSLKN